jgi:hypothetical protein
MPFKTGNAQHDANVVAAEQARQAAMAGTPTQAAAAAAGIAYHRSVFASALVNNISTSQAIYGLKQAGTGGY